MGSRSSDDPPAPGRTSACPASPALSVAARRAGAVARRRWTRQRGWRPWNSRADERLASLQREADASRARSNGGCSIGLRALEVTRDLTAATLAEDRGGTRRWPRPTCARVASQTRATHERQTGANCGRGSIGALRRLYAAGSTGTLRAWLSSDDLAAVRAGHPHAGRGHGAGPPGVRAVRRLKTELDTRRVELEQRTRDAESLRTKALDARDPCRPCHAGPRGPRPAGGRAARPHGPPRRRTRGGAHATPAAPRRPRARSFGAGRSADRAVQGHPALAGDRARGRRVRPSVVRRDSARRATLGHRDRGAARHAGAGQLTTAAWRTPTRFSGFGQLVIVDHGREGVSRSTAISTRSTSNAVRISTAATSSGRAESRRRASPRLYFELRIDARPVNPIEWLKR